jgi:hypothetical protein
MESHFILGFEDQQPIFFAVDEVGGEFTYSQA